MTNRRKLTLLLAVLAVLALVMVGRWLNARKIGGQEPEPFRIGPNFYYVGCKRRRAFLITGHDGNADRIAGYQTTAAMTWRAIAKLGFDTQT